MQCPYIKPNQGEFGFMCCMEAAGHKGDHKDAYGFSTGKWCLKKDYRCNECGSSPGRDGDPTRLERTLARIVIETCIAHGHPIDGEAPSVPKGKCACQCVPKELVPEEYR